MYLSGQRYWHYMWSMVGILAMHVPFETRQPCGYATGLRPAGCVLSKMSLLETLLGNGGTRNSNLLQGALTQAVADK